MHSHGYSSLDSIGAERLHRSHRLSSLFSGGSDGERHRNEGFEQRASRQIVEAHAPVEAAGGEAFAVGREGEREDPCTT